MLVWVSDCGQYYAVPYKHSGYSDYDVYTADGKQYWLGRRYIPKGFDDNDPRYLYPEFAHMVDSWHLERKANRRIIFTLGFCDTDPTIKIIPFTGNAVLKSYKATFSKKKAIRKSLLVSPSELTEVSDIKLDEIKKLEKAR